MYIVLILLILVIVFVPNFWVKTVMRKYQQHIDELPGTGGDLAINLVKTFNLDKIVSVNTTDDNNDHYNPIEKKIYLSEENYYGKSLTAVAVATHEFGHVLQHHTQYKPLLFRTRIATIIARSEKIASIILVGFPFVAILLKIPLFYMMWLLSGFIVMALPILLHLITLPVEFDASFNRALPILKSGKFLPDSAIPIIRKILMAAALTYVSASLSSLLNFYRWIAILRR